MRIESVPAMRLLLQDHFIQSLIKVIAHPIFSCSFLAIHKEQNSKKIIEFVVCVKGIESEIPSERIKLPLVGRRKNQKNAIKKSFPQENESGRTLSL